MSYSRKFRLPSFGAVFHLVGVLGAGMLPLARLLISRGYVVSGSDLRSPEGDLPQGLKFTQGHSPESVASADVCVFSLAVPEDAPELRRAVELGIPKVSRPELLGVVVESFPKSIAVAGSHGKSSVTAMLAALFECSNPTVLCGADIGDDGFIEGSGELLIYEACEYRDAFLSTRPTCAVLLNLELDHTDYFRNISALEASFSRFAAASERVIYNADDSRLSEICRELNSAGFGRGERAFYRCSPLGRGRFELYRRGERVGDAELSLLGEFNLMNATAAAAVACEFGIPWDKIRSAMGEFRGIPRRLESLGTLGGAPVFYDYAHHPTEIAAGIAALRGAYGGDITVVFRPHTYSRTVSLKEDFKSALGRADRVILLEVFAAREAEVEGVSSKHLAEEMGERALYAESQMAAAELLIGECRGVVVLMGAGDISELKRIIEKNLDK